VTEVLQSFLDSGTSFEGKVAFSGVVRIDGHFKGAASADGTLVIGSQGTVEADLEITKLVIEGTYRGSAVAKQSVEVGAGARVEGSISTPSLIVHEGASISGEVRMGEAPAAP